MSPPEYGLSLLGAAAGAFKRDAGTVRTGTAFGCRTPAGAGMATVVTSLMTAVPMPTGIAGVQPLGPHVDPQAGPQLGPLE